MVRKWFETSYNAILFQKQEDLIRFYNIVYLYCRDCRRLEYLTGKGKMNIITPASIKVISFLLLNSNRLLSIFFDFILRLPFTYFNIL